MTSGSPSSGMMSPTTAPSGFGPLMARGVRPPSVSGPDPGSRWWRGETTSLGSGSWCSRMRSRGWVFRSILEVWSFVNPDLTVYFERDPEDGWLGYDIRSTACGAGVGLAQSAIRDRRGLCARARSRCSLPRGPAALSPDIDAGVGARMPMRTVLTQPRRIDDRSR